MVNIQAGGGANRWVGVVPAVSPVDILVSNPKIGKLEAGGQSGNGPKVSNSPCKKQPQNCSRQYQGRNPARGSDVLKSTIFQVLFCLRNDNFIRL